MEEKINYPPSEILINFLSEKLNELNIYLSRLEIAERKPVAEGINLSESVTINCRTGKKSIFCKYEPVGTCQRITFSHRVGIEYESKVYKSMFNDSLIKMPYCYGSGRINGTNIYVMLLEYFHGYHNVSGNNNFEMKLAAASIGKIHHELENRVPPYIKKLDLNYFLHWKRTFEDILVEANIDDKWLIELCTFYERHAVLLSNNTPTLVHGELYTKNVITNGLDHACPIDWESASSGPGEIDMAALLDNKLTEPSCIKDYYKARWPDNQMDIELFQQRLILARLYFYFRWLSKKRYKGIRSFLRTEWVNVRMRNIGIEAGCYS